MFFQATAQAQACTRRQPIGCLVHWYLPCPQPCAEILSSVQPQGHLDRSVQSAIFT